MSNRQPNLLSLSTELHVQICDYLHPVHSTCLGLVCRRLYAAHFIAHKRVPLNAFTYECPIPSTSLCTVCFLFTHLENWKPPHLKYCAGCHKFCKTHNSRQTHLPHRRCHKCYHQEPGQHSQYWMGSMWPLSPRT
jgi:hypothetical protein